MRSHSSPPNLHVIGSIQRHIFISISFSHPAMFRCHQGYANELHFNMNRILITFHCAHVTNDTHSYQRNYETKYRGFTLNVFRSFKNRTKLLLTQSNLHPFRFFHTRINMYQFTISNVMLACMVCSNRTQSKIDKRTL